MTGGQFTPAPMSPPYATRCLFSNSSIWILLLAFCAWPRHSSLSFALVCNAVASFVHWTHFRINSRACHLDRFFSMLVLFFVITRSRGLHFRVLACACVLCFGLGSLAAYRGKWDEQLCWHALFRYCAFWMIYAFIQPLGVGVVLMCSSLYATHVMIMLQWCIDEVHFMQRGGYPPPANKKG